MKVRDAITEKKTIYRITIVVGGTPTFVLSDCVKMGPDLKDAFLEINQNDFMYSLDKYRDESDKKVKTSVNGDYLDHPKYMGAGCVMGFEPIEATDTRYETFVNIIDGCIAAKCNISIPPDKEIVIARS